MRTLISGATGMVGSALVESLHTKGHSIRCLQRNKKPGAESIWLTENLFDSNSGSNEPFDTVIHLAGENIADGRWTAAKKRRIKNSRVEGTKELVDYLSGLPHKPKTFICASAIGYYGNRGDQVVSEKSPAGDGFLASVCKEWEAEASKAAFFGARVVLLRFGMVLSPNGGALAKMLPPFKAGFGGTIGNGKQYMSWISIRDLIEVIDFSINNESLSGPVNAVTPKAVTNKDFTTQLADVLDKPARFPVPPFGLKLLFGEMAGEMLLSSTRVRPERLMASGYNYRDTNLKETLNWCIHGEQS
ncbi:TIGR01777 family oxidoreductase [Desulfosediminicola ganghwensis]|uniref:TIGR01777 family oxidoreductase n=1 Tax=Desulfosediminicola ganghwensis TaxID=2569540 RepID=UPI0010ABEC73|nr:TIGR01777 family oxidoreductase [Desulfosediminicola ganghwensis]